MANNRHGAERRRRPRTLAAEPICIAVCGDRPLYRASVASLIQRDRRFRVVAESTNDTAGIQRALKSDPAIVILDFEVTPEHGLEFLESLLDSIAPHPVVVIASTLHAEAC